MMKVRTEDLIKFYRHLTIKYHTKLEEKNLKYATQKSEYESKFLPKLFGWKYENSYRGNKSIYGNWDFWVTKYHINDCRAKLLELEYFDKCDLEYSNLEEDMTHKFFVYAKENNLPY